MTQFYMVRILADAQAFYQWAAERGGGWEIKHRSKTGALDEGRAMHHLLAESFGKKILQPFRVFFAPRTNLINIYAYSQADSLSLQQIAHHCMMPEVLSVFPLDRIESKPMPDDWVKGKKFAFDILVRPVHRLPKPRGDYRKGAEIDMFLAESLRLFPDQKMTEDQMVKAGYTREAIYREWLENRLKSAVNITAARLVRYKRAPVVRRTHRDGDNNVVSGVDATFHGELEVVDSAAFAHALVRGVGRHTAYGYGMLLLRPVAR